MSPEHVSKAQRDGTQDEMSGFGKARGVELLSGGFERPPDRVVG